MIDWEALAELEDDYCAIRRDWDWAEKLGERYVGGEGDNPKAFIIGEAPGAYEAVEGRPFVGPAGRILRDLMALADLYTEGFTATVTSTGFAADTRKIRVEPNCWLTNVVKFRPPKNRNPTELEIKAFRPLLMDEWNAVGAPRLIVAVGGIALRAVTGKYVSILRAAGKCHWYTSRQGNKLAIWPMIHPAFGLRNPGVQPMLEQDWELLGKWRSEHGH